MNYSEAKTYIITRLRAELDPRLTYHGVHHTLDVLNVTEQLARECNVSERETVLLKTAALFHDSGFLTTRVEHEAAGCDLVREVLPRFAYTGRQIEQICGMIMATKIPQNPQNYLEDILADADLDYLGRDDFYVIGDTLFDELKTFGVIETEEQWNRIQIGFLKGHGFFTAYNRQHRQPKKLRHLAEIEKIVAGYEAI